MIVTSLRHALIPAVEQLISDGAPYVRLRTSSDYWLYAELFSSTCPVAVENDQVIGVVIVFRSQDKPEDVYIATIDNGVFVTSDYKGSGKHRAVYQLNITQDSHRGGMNANIRRCPTG